MSSPQRRKELATLHEKEEALRYIEQRRKDTLTLWERIEELTVDSDLKDVLHRIAQGEREDF